MSKAQQGVVCLQQHSPPTISSGSKSLPRNGSNITMKSSLKISRPNLVRCNTEPTRKSVHFSTTNLEDIRPFLKTQSPVSVSMKEKLDVFWDIDDDSSDDCQSDTEEEKLAPRKLVKKPQENKKSWTLLTPGLTPYAMGRISPASRPMVYLDTVQLTPDGKALKAVTYVRNICFQKYVALRYSINSWASFDETAGTWSADIRKYDRDGGFDRFDVLIPLDRFPEQTLNTRSIQACVRFVANSTEYWDNKGGKNYEFYLKNPRLSSASVSSVASNVAETPKSHSRPVTSSAPRPRALSAGSIDSHDYDSEDNENYDELSTSDYLKRVGVRMRQPGSSKKDSALFDRYSFAASYNAAPINNIQSDSSEPFTDHKKDVKYQEVPVFNIPVAKVKDLSFRSQTLESVTNVRAATPVVKQSHTKPVVLKEGFLKQANAVPTKINTVSHMIVGAPPPIVIPVDTPKKEESEKTSPAELWESDSYKEFVSRYCFFTPNALEKPKSSTETRSLPPIEGSRNQHHTDPDPNDSSGGLSSLFNVSRALPHRI